MEISKQRIEDRPINFVTVHIYSEDGCDPKEDEYQVELISHSRPMDISTRNGTEPVYLITTAVAEFVSEREWNSDKQNYIELVLQESGEWQDVFWVGWYEVIRATDLMGGQSD